MKIKIDIEQGDMDRVEDILGAISASNEWTLRFQEAEMLDGFEAVLDKRGIASEKRNLELISRDRPKCIRTAMLIDKEVLGHGEFEHGITLMQEYFEAWINNVCLPEYLMFINSGVKLLTRNSNVVEYLEEFQKKGVKILYSKESVEYYNFYGLIEESLGRQVNLNEIIKVEMEIEKIIKI